MPATTFLAAAYEAGRICRPGVLWHALRHTYASLLAAGGIKHHEIELLMGHKVAGTTGLYLHVMRETFDKVDVILDQAFGDALHAHIGTRDSTRSSDEPSPRDATSLRTVLTLPRISEFYGIVIWMYHDELHHRGRPHFHARYGGDEASIDIESLLVIAGALPPRALRLVREWGSEHQDELRLNWARARRHEPLVPIDPLP